MSYLALARKWRPRTFSQLVGQEHINKALINSLTHQRLHHAYLFTGTRGIGKTSIARLLAKSLNCEQGIRPEPCLQCDACLAIEQGRFVDLIEIDGASRTRVEDTRELLDNVPYSPASGRFKIYLIDEVHMLSTHSFNALLKTLEEPPAHVKFLLATTDPQKLPVTVLSRCLQFNLKHLAAERISEHLQFILSAEAISYEIEALDLLAKAAKGSMRDALSLLDQAIAYANPLTKREVQAILGYTQQDYAMQLLQALAVLDSQKLVSLSRQIAQEGGHFRYVLDALLEYLHQITLSQNLPIESPLSNTSTEIKLLAKQFSPEDTHLFYQIGMKGIDEISLAPSFAIGFEMILMRMFAFRPAPFISQPQLAYEVLNSNPHTEVPTIEALAENCSSKIVAEPELVEITNKVPTDENWENILPQLKLTGLALNAAENAQWIGKSGRHISFRVAKGHESLFTPTVLSRIETALGVYYKEPIKIIITSDESLPASPAQQKQIKQSQLQKEAELELQNDPFFQKLQQEFSAELVKNSITSIKDEL